MIALLAARLAGHDWPLHFSVPWPLAAGSVVTLPGVCLLDCCADYRLLPTGRTKHSSDHEEWSEVLHASCASYASHASRSRDVKRYKRCILPRLALLFCLVLTGDLAYAGLDALAERQTTRRAD